MISMSSLCGLSLNMNILGAPLEFCERLDLLRTYADRDQMRTCSVISYNYHGVRTFVQRLLEGVRLTCARTYDERVQLA